MDKRREKELLDYWNTLSDEERHAIRSRILREAEIDNNKLEFDRHIKYLEKKGYIIHSGSNDYTHAKLINVEKELGAELTKNVEGYWVIKLIYNHRAIHISTSEFRIPNDNFESVFQAQMLDIVKSICKNK